MWADWNTRSPLFTIRNVITRILFWNYVICFEFDVGFCSICLQGHTSVIHLTHPLLGIHTFFLYMNHDFWQKSVLRHCYTVEYLLSEVAVLFLYWGEPVRWLSACFLFSVIFTITCYSQSFVNCSIPDGAKNGVLTDGVLNAISSATHCPPLIPIELLANKRFGPWKRLRYVHVQTRIFEPNFRSRLVLLNLR